mmetsp:Transcript_28450/g.69230  ORF Transcript_28450/g.69230 Transcript_28450/m.69230 type:complete len:609 (+) Transcript_28450:66-1892(+)
MKDTACRPPPPPLPPPSLRRGQRIRSKMIIYPFRNDSSTFSSIMTTMIMLMYLLLGLLVLHVNLLSTFGFSPLYSNSNSRSRLNEPQYHQANQLLHPKETTRRRRKTAKLLPSRKQKPWGRLDAASAVQDNGSGKISDDHDAQNSQKKSFVWKFGGSSLANAERVDHVCHLIKEYGETLPRAVVCSAMGKTTNMLLQAGEAALKQGKVDDETMDAIRELHKKAMNEFGFDERMCQPVLDLLDECRQLLVGVSITQELTLKSKDKLVSYGERCSVRIVSERLRQLTVPAVAIDAWDAGIWTDDKFGDANLLPDYEKSISGALSKIEKGSDDDDDHDSVYIVTGFLGKTEDGHITTLGRGGSDLTATAVGAALESDEIWAWKDVDGVLSADPRRVPHAIPLDYISYEQAQELAVFGAQVLHPIAMQPALKAGIPVRVKNSYNPEATGTVIGQKKDAVTVGSGRLVTAITYQTDVTVLDISSSTMMGTYGFLARVFQAFEKHRLSVDVLASSEVSVSLTLDQKQNPSEIQGLLTTLADCAEITRKDGRSILTLIADVDRSSQVLATVFNVFAKEDIHVEMMSQGASKVNISFIVSSDDLQKAMLKLHTCFF